MSKFLDRQYGNRPWSPPKQTKSKSRFVQPEDVIGTVSERERQKRERWIEELERRMARWRNDHRK